MNDMLAFVVYGKVIGATPAQITKAYEVFDHDMSDTSLVSSHLEQAFRAAGVHVI